MKVIQVSTKNQCKCTNCGSVLQPDPSDIRIIHRPVAIGHSEIECMPEPEDHYAGQVTCPVCQAAVNVATTREMRRAKMTSDRRADHDL